MVQPDDPARDVYTGLLKKAQRMFVPGKGNVLYFLESEFQQIVKGACNTVIIHLPPPEIDYRDPGGQLHSVGIGARPIMRKVDDFEIKCTRGLFGERWDLYFKGNQVKYNLSGDLPSLGKLVETSQREPVRIMFEGLMKDPHYLYKGVWYRDTNRLSEEDGTNLLLDYERKLERKLARLRTQSTSEGQDTTREPIPPDTQVFVWNRDGGRCVRCGSQANLEFDHIIPLSKGGSNTARNLQLLCQDCNRTKAGNVGE